MHIMHVFVCMTKTMHQRDRCCCSLYLPESAACKMSRFRLAPQLLMTLITTTMFLKWDKRKKKHNNTTLSGITQSWSCHLHITHRHINPRRHKYISRTHISTVRQAHNEQYNKLVGVGAISWTHDTHNVMCPHLKTNYSMQIMRVWSLNFAAKQRFQICRHRWESVCMFVQVGTHTT